MTQDERWQEQYRKVRDFMEMNQKNPSHHRLEVQDMLNWLKANRKKLNAEELNEPCLSKFKGLLELGEEFKRINQFQ